MREGHKGSAAGRRRTALVVVADALCKGGRKVEGRLGQVDALPEVVRCARGIPPAVAANSGLQTLVCFRQGHDDNQTLGRQRQPDRQEAHLHCWPTGQQAPGKVALAQAPKAAHTPPVPPHWSKALSMKVQPG